MFRILDISGRCLLGCGLALALFVSLGIADAKSQETVLYAFQGGTDGGYLEAGLIMDSAGNLYGTTVDYGADGYGTVFKVTPNGTERVLLAFDGGTGGAYPFAGPIMDSADNLYGTTYAGGAYGYGIVFRVTPNGKETVLHSFKGGHDGDHSYAGLIMDSSGNLYGTTYAGGANKYCYGGCGTVFRVSSKRTETVLLAFNGASDGGNPSAGLIADKKSNLYGTTEVGGAGTWGTIFKLSPKGAETVLFGFNGSDGGIPSAGLIRDSLGDLYGTTEYGGGSGCGGSGCGVVFKLAPDGTETVLHSFCTQDGCGGDGSKPYANLIADKKGNLYGTTSEGGANGYGTVFKISPSGTETVLYSFTGGNDGAAPYAGLIADSVGTLFGTTSEGGGTGCNGYGCGTVFKLIKK